MERWRRLTYPCPRTALSVLDALAAIRRSQRLPQLRWVAEASDRVVEGAVRRCLLGVRSAATTRRLPPARSSARTPATTAGEAERTTEADEWHRPDGDDVTPEEVAWFDTQNPAVDLHGDNATVRIRVPSGLAGLTADRPASRATSGDPRNVRPRRPTEDSGGGTGLDSVSLTAGVASSSSVAGIGLFRALHETIQPGFAGVRRRTASELNAITMPDLQAVFDPLRCKEIKRARLPADALAAVAALKTNKLLKDAQWAVEDLEGSTHGIHYGCQVVFRADMTPDQIGEAMTWAVPFIIGGPSDPTQASAWRELRKEATAIYPRLEANIAASKGSPPHALSTSIFSTTRKLVFAFFDLRASMLLPLMTQSHGPRTAGIHAIAGGYIDQANMIRACLSAAEDMIDDGALVADGEDPIVVENAARTAIYRPFLLALIKGRARPKGAASMIAAYEAFTPSTNTLQAATLAALLAASPFATGLPTAFLQGIGATLPPSVTPVAPPAAQRAPPAASQPPPPPYKAPPVAPPPPPAVAPPARGYPSGSFGPLQDDPTRAGFRRDGVGLQYHMGWYNGEYSIPAGWNPPPGATWLGPGPAPGPTSTPAPRSSSTRTWTALSIPCAKMVAGGASPFPGSSTQPCDVCGKAGHAQYECPKRFLDTYHAPLPGFLASGEQDPAAWSDGALTETARLAMADYLHQRNVPPHRKYQVTLAHIAAGTPPPLKA